MRRFAAATFGVACLHLVFGAIVRISGSGMGCGDHCPWVPAKRREDWALPNPRDINNDGYRAVRDEIGVRVRDLLASLA